MNDQDWRAFVNRSYAYFLKGMLTKAEESLVIAADINPSAKQVLEIRGMINEMGLRPRVIMEDHL
jgi:hypothetical protein